MYLDKSSEVRLAHILIANAVMSYEPWLKIFCEGFEVESRPLILSEISLKLPEKWPPGQHSDPPEWAKQDYAYADLRRPIRPEAVHALRGLVREQEKTLEEELLQHGAMTFYVLEGLRLHLLTAAAHSVSRKAEGVWDVDVHEAAKWKCWAWPWC